MKKVILGLVLSMFILPLAFTAPVYTEGVSYQVEVLEDGMIQVRKAVRVYKDGVEIGKTYHRHILEPEADLTNEVDTVKDIANAAWTPTVVTKYKAKKAARKAAMRVERDKE